LRRAERENPEPTLKRCRSMREVPLDTETRQGISVTMRIVVPNGVSIRAGGGQPE
jgi:hypothetical protein